MLAYVDKEIVNHLDLPTGPYCNVDDIVSLKWEYAIAIDYRLSKMELLADFPHNRTEVKKIYQSIYDDFRGPISHILEASDNFLNFRSCQMIWRMPLSIDVAFKEATLGMRAALAEDVKKFGDLPVHFTDVKLYMEHEARRMAKDMNMTRYDDFNALRALHRSFKMYKLCHGHENALQQLMGQSHTYHDMVMYLTLLERIDALEAKVKELEAK